MTVREALAKFGALREGHRYTEEELTAWLTELDARIFEELYLTHLPNAGERFPDRAPCYDPETDGDAVLLAPSPHDRIYPAWLETRTDYESAEIGRYNDGAAVFNAAYAAYRNRFNAAHVPRGTRLRLL